MTSVAPPYAEVPFTGDPYDLIEPLERLYGSLLFYRLGAEDGRRLAYVSLENAWRIRPDGIHRGGTRFHGDVTDLLDVLHGEARRTPIGWAPDVAVALSYDLTWRLRAADGVPNPESPPGDDAALLGFAGRVDRAVVCCPDTGTLRCRPDDADRVREIVASLPSRAAEAPGPDVALTDVITPIDRERYAEHVERARDHLLRGDIYQVLVAVAVRVRPKAGTHRYFADVARRYHSADFSYWFGVDGVRVFGNCSLPHLRTDGGRVDTRVFAGTQPASRTEAEREAYRQRLRADPKYFAEHVMLVDLERNDFGTFSRVGKVAVDRYLEPLVIGPTTYLASDVVGEIADGHRLADVITANFPRGVAIGAPKIRAQEIIADLESGPRGFYTGMVGVYDGRRDRLTSNTIVTCAQAVPGGDGTLTLHCGGGLVAGSDAPQELRELDLKLKYLL
jgi:anthranilate synthase component 1